MTRATAGSGTLRDLRVLNLSRVLAGPYCTQMLADHGAHVIKIESPAGDDTRICGLPYLPDGMSAYHAGINRNKENLCLDLSLPQGQTVLWRMLERVDLAQALTSQQALYRDMLVNHGDYRGVGVPIKVAQSSGAVRLPPAAKGADTRKVLKDAGYRPDEIASLLEAGVVREPERSTATAEDWQGR